MSRFTFLLAVAALVVAMLLANGAVASVDALDISNFDITLEKVRLAVVAFTRPDRCPICELLVKELEATDKLLDERDVKTIRLFRAETDRSNELAVRHGIGSYPTMKLFKNGVELSRPYRGGYTAAEIADYLVQSLQPPSTAIEELEDAQAVVPSPQGGLAPDAKIVIFGFFKKVNYDLKALEEAEDELRDTGFYKFVHASTDKISNFYGHRHTFAVYNPAKGADDQVAAWPASSAIDPTAAVDFIATHGLPLVAELNASNAWLYRRSSRPVFRLFVNLFANGARRKRDELVAALRGVAEREPRFAFVYAGFDYQDEPGSSLFDLDYGEQAKAGGGAWAIYHRGRRYRPALDQAEFDPEAALQFCRDFLGPQQPAPYLRSQAPPAAAPKPGEVVTVVGRTFRDIVFNESRVVVLLVHAPWCGHCTSLMPVWRALARRYAERPSEPVAVAQIDGTSNELPRGYMAVGYPTIFAAVPGHKEAPRDFSGTRSLEALEAFVEDALTAFRG